MDRGFSECGALYRLFVPVSDYGGPQRPLLMHSSGCWMSDPLNNYFGRRGTVSEVLAASDWWQEN